MTTSSTEPASRWLPPRIGRALLITFTTLFCANLAPSSARATPIESPIEWSINANLTAGSITGELLGEFTLDHGFMVGRVDVELLIRHFSPISFSSGSSSGDFLSILGDMQGVFLTLDFPLDGAISHVEVTAAGGSICLDGAVSCMPITAAVGEVTEVFVPEPSSLVLLGGASVAVVVRVQAERTGVAANKCLTHMSWCNRTVSRGAVPDPRIFHF